MGKRFILFLSELRKEPPPCEALLLIIYVLEVSALP